ncbi:FMN-binding protein [Kitasatospora sp. GAS1066B]|uniref:FMN-binding protein n=1 Tax=Kitasatospora sp. GAS1066B TaxID=3156271 RepID=UPI003511A16C
MRKTTMALLSTSAGLALLIGAKAASAGAPKPALAATSRLPGAPSSAGHAPTQSAAPASGPSSGPTTAAAGGRFAGSVVDTPYGPVQVQAVLSGGRLTDVTVLQQTSGGHSSQIDSYALPQLKSEALKAQSANIDAVSGATYTSDGYAQSLQAALDAAHR